MESNAPPAVSPWEGKFPRQRRSITLSAHPSLRRLLLGALAAGALTLTSASAAAAYEWDVAKPGSVPDGLPCTETARARVCFEHHGDKLWVKDRKGDGVSAIAKWRVTYNSREGYCRNRLGAGRWGVCNKNFLENVWVDWWATVYDRESNSFPGSWSPGRDART
jgi:hypothetical protein